MQIDSLTPQELSGLIEGYFCYPSETENTLELQKLLCDLIEWHEPSDEELLKGFEYYCLDRGQRPQTLIYDSEFRTRALLE